MNTEKTPPPESNINTGSIPGLVSVSKVHMNLSEEVIVTTEDKLRLCLTKHFEKIKRKNDWIAPLGVLLSIILTFVTATFRDVGLEAATWTAVFLIAGILSLIWLVYTIMQALHTVRVEDIVEELKKGAK